MFSLIKGRLYGSAHPYREDLSGFVGAGVELVVSLTASPLSSDALRSLRAAEIDYLHKPITDFTPPSIRQMDEIYEAYRAATRRGGAVLVHCGAGVGRTGTVLSCILALEEGLSARAAMTKVREVRPGAVETAGQEEFVADWLGSRRKKTHRKSRKKRRER